MAFISNRVAFWLALLVLGATLLTSTTLPSMSVAGASAGQTPPPTLCTFGFAMAQSYFHFGAGWNLVAAPDGMLPLGVQGPLYTWQGGDTGYEAIAAGAALQGGAGYWAYYASPVSGMAHASTPAAVTLTVPTDQWVLIGNPRHTQVSVTGADAVYAYDPTQGYVPATTLAVGEGAWALASSGTITFIADTPCPF